MAIKSKQICKDIIFITNKLLQFRGRVHHHIICRVALENVLRVTVIFLTVVCDVRA